MLAPHYAVNAEFCQGGCATEGFKNALVFIRGNAVLGQQLRGYRYRLGYRSRRGGGHHDYLHCRMTFTLRTRPSRGEEEMSRGPGGIGPATSPGRWRQGTCHAIL